MYSVSIPWRHRHVGGCVAVNILFSQSCEFKLLHTSWCDKCVDFMTSCALRELVPRKCAVKRPRFYTKYQRYAKNASIRCSNHRRPEGVPSFRKILYLRAFPSQDIKRAVFLFKISSYIYRDSFQIFSKTLYKILKYIFFLFLKNNF